MDSTNSTTTSHTLSKTTFGIGTRQSPLALLQTSLVTSHLSSLHPSLSFPLHKLETTGDKNQVTALHQFNAKSLWTSELEALVIDGSVDLIVHSAKDMPTQLPAGCKLGASCLRSERRDAVVISTAGMEKGWRTLADLPEGAVVGTSSVRRIAQLKRHFPHLKVADMRGNIGTRLSKLDNPANGFSALILAATGVQRVGLGERVSSYLSWKEGKWLGPVGQGALGVEVREGDSDVDVLCKGMMEDGEKRAGEGRRVWLEVLTERSLLRTLEGGCSVPLGVETEWTSKGESGKGWELRVIAAVWSVDGQQEVSAEVMKEVTTEEMAEEFGLEVARVLVERGAAKILEDITLNRKIIEESGGA